LNVEDILEKNKSLRNLHAGRRCFIIGNGPSLQSQDISLSRDEISIVVSWFHRHPQAKQIHPRYWVMADPGCWQRPDQPFLPAIQHVHSLEMNTKLFVPTGGFSYYANMHTGPFIDLHFFHYDQRPAFEPTIDFCKPIPPYGQNVVVVALMLAFHMGCNPIYLVGCDHDFLNVSRSEYEKKEERHFYKENNAAKYALEFEWEEFQRCMARLVYEYDQLKLYAGQNGFDVFNATRGGCLEHFPRVEFESLFSHIALPISPVELPTEEIFQVTDTAIRLIEADDFRSALILLDEAIHQNINRNDRVQGLFYLKAACLAKLRRYDEALLFARQDHACNLDNRGISSLLINQLEEVANDCRRVA